MPVSAAPDPHDPLVPRYDDPSLFRWRRGAPRSAYRRPLRLTAAMLLVALVAFLISLLLGSL